MPFCMRGDGREGPRWRACAGAAVAVLAAVLLSGCGLSGAQKAAVGKFAAAAADLGAVAGEEFRQSRFDVMAMNRARLGLGDRAVKADKLDGYFTLADVSARVDAAHALREYGELLGRLAAGSESAAVGAAAGRLVGSLTKLRAAGRIEVSDEKLGAIGRAVAGIGGLVVEAERARAIDEVTEATGPAVRRLAELIRRDFDPEGEHWSVGYEAVAVRLGERAANARVDLGDAPTELDRAAAWLGAQAALAEAEALRGENMQRFREVSKRIAASATALVLAEKDMRGALGERAMGLDDLDIFADQVAELVTTYRLLRK